jgi:hypothetical protein
MKLHVAVAVASILMSSCGATQTPEAPASTTASPTVQPKVIDYGEDGVALFKTDDVEKLRGAPQDFKNFLTGVVAKVTAGSDPSDQCAPRVTVTRIDPAGFASGAISDCGGAAVIWANRDGTWKEIWSGQIEPDCEVMKDARVPKSIVDIAGGNCLDRSTQQLMPYEP